MAAEREQADLAPRGPTARPVRRWREVLVRRRLVLLAPIVVTVATALACALLQPDGYEASARIAISPTTDPTAFDPQTGVRQDQSREVQLQADLVTSAPVRSQVRMLIGASPDVTTGVVANADVVEVSVTAPSLSEARTVVDAYVGAYVALRRDRATAAALDVIGVTVRQLDDINRRLGALAPSDGSVSAQQRVLILRQGALRDKLDRLQVSAGSRSNGATPLGPAQGSVSPVSPRPARSAGLALLAGGLIGLAGVAMAEFADDTIWGPGDVGVGAAALPVLGVVPAFGSRRRNETLASLHPHAGPAAEAYRSVRTGLAFVGGGTNRVVQVTSPNAGEGKTTTAANLAVAVAAAGREVCLVSADLRRPRVEVLFDLDQEPGLTSVVLGATPVVDVIVAVEAQPRLFVIPAGPPVPDPTSVIGSAAFRRLVGELSEAFDLVVVDSAPVLPVADAVLLSEVVHTTVMVVAAEVTTRRDLDRAVELLAQVDAPVGALVLNHLPS